MIRVLLFIIAVAALALGAVWIADRPGDIAINWLGYRVETSVMVGATALAAVVVATVLAWSTIIGIFRAPAAISRFRSNRRVSRGFRAISRGIIAIGAGDAPAARRFASEARRLMPNEPLALLLKAQTAQLAGDGSEAERTFRTMAKRHDTKLLGLHGLFVEAQRRDDPATARALAEEALKSEPTLPWAAEAILQHRCAEGDWSGALAALDNNRHSGLVTKEAYKRQRAVLLTGRALSGTTDRETAKGLALEALKLSPGLVPAAALAGRLLGEAGQARKASRVIEKAWAANPHPELAQIYAEIGSRQSSRDRLARIRVLARHSPTHPETALAVAQAALDAQEFGLARESLAPLLGNPTQRVAILMAELEEKESGNVGRSREWMARALAAPRDPAWTADGLVSNAWMPISPATGRLDAFEWRIPVAHLPHGPVIEHDFARKPYHPPPAATVAPNAPPAETAPPAPREDAAAKPPRDDSGTKPGDYVAAKPREDSTAKPLPDGASAPAATVLPEAAAQTVTARAADQADVPPAPAVQETRSPEASVPPGDGAAAPVIPLVHVPDDPGPEPEAESEPESEADAKVEKRKSTWSLFR